MSSVISSVDDLKAFLSRVNNHSRIATGSQGYPTDGEWKEMMDMITAKGGGKLWMGQSYHPYPGGNRPLISPSAPDMTDGQQEAVLEEWRQERKEWYNSQAELDRLRIRRRVGRLVVSEAQWNSQLERLNLLLNGSRHHLANLRYPQYREIMTLFNKVMTSCTVRRNFEWSTGVWVEWIDEVTYQTDHPDRPDREPQAKVKTAADLIKLIRNDKSAVDSSMPSSCGIHSVVRQLDLQADPERGGGIFLTQ
jgi:hypothetical protein